MNLPENKNTPGRTGPWTSRASRAVAALCAVTATSIAAAQPAPTAESAGVEAAATPELPLDYANPHGRMIDIALIRLPASDPSARMGSLFLNPGGPGVSGVDEVRDAAESLYSAEVLTHFDIVGFDPRFVGRSQAASCILRDEYAEVFEGVSLDPKTPDEERRSMDAYTRYSALCAERAPDIQYASTGNVARDLELLRRAVGDEKINYAGYSYGSVLGQTYAALFPSNIRTLLIDGVADAQAWSGTPETMSIPFWARIGNAIGASEALGEIIHQCGVVGPARCSFAAFGDPEASFTRLLDEARMRPIELDGGRFDDQMIVDIAESVFPSFEQWSFLADDLSRLYKSAFPDEAGYATPALSEHAFGSAANLAERTRREPRDGEALRQALDWEDHEAQISAVRCSDALVPRTLEDWSKAAAAEEQRAPYFGRSYTFDGLVCASWQLPSPGRYGGPYDLATSAPILVANPRFDPRTPLHNAQTVANRIPGARLIVLDVVAHTTAKVESTCMTDAVTKYFVSGELPPEGTVCAPDFEYYPVRTTEDESSDEQP
jgi:pimeloyl-ACP methyl ester carboxylesterase